MSTPFKLKKEASLQSAVQHIACEVVSTMSVLNMLPDPIPGAKEACEAEGDMPYLSKVDSWAAHAMEHLRSLAQDCNTMQKIVQRETHARFRLERELEELRAQLKGKQ